MVDFSKKTVLYFFTDDDYNLVFANAETIEFFSASEKYPKCYEFLQGRSEPCENCILHKNIDTAIIFSKIFNAYFNVSIANTTYANRDCKAFILTPCAEENRTNLYNITDFRSYDMLFEADLTNDSIHYIYNNHQKFYIPVENYALSTYIDEKIDLFVHPEDLPRVKNFWKMLIQKNENTNTNVNYDITYRRIRNDGTWHSCHAFIGNLKKGVSSNNKLLVFVREMEDAEVQQDNSVSFSNLNSKADLLSYIRNTLMNDKQQDKYCLIFTNIEHYHIYTEWYGKDSGYKYLSAIAAKLSDLSQKYNGYVAGLNDNKFAIFLKYDSNILATIENEVTKAARKYSENAGFLPHLSMAVADLKSESDITADKLYERTSFALSLAKENQAARSVVYDDKLTTDIISEHYLISQIQSSLKNGNFTFYLQPQCDMFNGKISGAEALMRWSIPDKGAIPPDVFIPLFEKNGFITMVDTYIWDKVCAWMKHWKDRGNPVFPVSINISRIDILRIDVAKHLKDLVKKYGIEPRFLELEITESAYTENNRLLLKTIGKLKKAGFSISMDDFGTGYSSLYMLKDLNIDILKIDMKFLSKGNLSKVSSIFESIHYIASYLGLRVIIEGVETKEQVDILKSLDLHYCQGYYYYKPMPVNIFENMIFADDLINPLGFNKYHNIDNGFKQILADSVVTNGMFDEIIGAAGLFEIEKGIIKLVKANKHYLEITGMEDINNSNYSNDIVSYIFEDDRKKFIQSFENAYAVSPNKYKTYIRGITSFHTVDLFENEIFYLKEENHKRIFVVLLSKANEQTITLHEKDATVDNRHIISDFPYALSLEDTRDIDALIASEGDYYVAKIDISDNNNVLFICSHMLHDMGYSGYKDLLDKNGCITFSQIFDGHKTLLASSFFMLSNIDKIHTHIVDMKCKDGSVIPCFLKFKVNGDSTIIIIGKRIDRIIEAQSSFLTQYQGLLDSNRKMMDDMNAIPGAYLLTFADEKLTLFSANPSFFEIIGLTILEFEKNYRNSFLALVHPADRALLMHAHLKAKKDNNSYNLKYRISYQNDRYIYVLESAKYLENNGRGYYQSFFVNIDEDYLYCINAKDVMRNAPDTVFFLELTKQTGLITLNVIANNLKNKYDFCDIYSPEFQKQIESPEGYIISKKIDELKNYFIGSFVFAKQIKKMESYTTDFDISYQEKQKTKVTTLSVYAKFVNQTNNLIRFLFFIRDNPLVVNGNHQIELESKIQLLSKITDYNFFTWNLTEKTFTLDGPLKEPQLNLNELINQHSLTIENFPECILSHRYIAHGHLTNLISFTKKINKKKNLAVDNLAVPLVCKDGSSLLVKFHWHNVSTNNAQIKIVGTFQNITSIRMHEENEVLSNQLINQYTEKAIFVIKSNIYDNESEILKNGDLWVKNYGELPSSFRMIQQRLASKLLLPEHRKEFLQVTSQSNVINSFNKHYPLPKVNCQITYKNEIIWVFIEIIVVKSKFDGALIAYFFIFDNDKKMRKELELSKLASQDSLTTLNNRATAIPLITKSIARHEYTTASIIIFDIDNFKMVNDIFGHLRGDAILKDISVKLKRTFNRKSIICRFGGDEFLIYVPGTEENIIQKINRFTKMSHTILKTTNSDLVISISAGYAMFPEQGSTFEELIKKADIAAFAAKNSGKNLSLKYDKSMKEVREIK